MIYKHNQYQTKNRDNTVRLLIVSTLFAIFYPILISFYVVLPLFIGLAGYLMILGIKNDNIAPILVSSLYLLLLDINTSIPIFSGIIATLLCYLLVLPRLRIILNCKICISAIIVSSIYIIYFIIAYIFDFAFELESVHVSMLVLVSMLLDIILVTMI